MYKFLVFLLHKSELKDNNKILPFFEFGGGWTLHRLCAKNRFSTSTYSWINKRPLEFLICAHAHSRKTRVTAQVDEQCPNILQLQIES